MRPGPGVRTDRAGRRQAPVHAPPGAPGGQTGAAPPPLRRNRDFLLLWTGQALSALGSSVAAIVYPLLALAATGSATRAGVVGLTGLAATVLARLPAGVLADRYPLKPLMVVADLVRAGTTASVVLAVVAGRVTLAHLVLAAVVGGLCGAVADPAHGVAVRHVVPAAQLPGALARNEARGHLAALAGQPAGGFLYAAGAALPVLVDALSYLAAALLAARVRHLPRAGPGAPGRTGTGTSAGRGTPAGRGAPAGRGTPARRVTPVRHAGAGGRAAGMWRDIRVGLRYVWRSPFLRVTLACAAGINLVFAGLPLVVVAAQSASGTAPAALGVLFSLAATGGLAGAWLAEPLQRRLAPARLVYLFGWTSTAALAAIGAVHQPYAVGALLAAVFLTATPANAMLVAAQMDVTPPELQGRVFSAALLTVGIAGPLGPLLGGFLFEKAGRVPTFAGFAAVVAALTVAMHASRPVRTMRRPGGRYGVVR